MRVWDNVYVFVYVMCDCVCISVYVVCVLCVCVCNVCVHECVHVCVHVCVLCVSCNVCIQACDRRVGIIIQYKHCDVKDMCCMWETALSTGIYHVMRFATRGEEVVLPLSFNYWLFLISMNSITKAKKFLQTTRVHPP